MEELDQQRIIALDLRPRSFAFVVFEDSREVLDWGARSFRGGVNMVRIPLGPKVARLLDEYVPEVLVLKYPQVKKLKQITHTVRNTAKMYRVPVRVISAKALRETFAGQNRNKQEIASTVATRFPELLSILPPKRKPWQSEDYRMSIFDAAAVGIAYFASEKSMETTSTS